MMRKLLAALVAAPLLVTLLAPPSQADPFGPRAELLRDIVAGPGSSEPAGAAALDSRMVFWATTPRVGPEPWITDGTRSGTRPLRDVNAGRDGSTDAKAIQNMVTAGDRVFFVADDGSHGDELWVTDGTSRRTHLVRDVRPGPAPSLPRDLVAVGNRVFFAADDGVHGAELWVSNGTRRGTRLVADIAPGALGAELDSLTAFGSGVVFSAKHQGAGEKPWFSNGTRSGTFSLGGDDPLVGADPSDFAVLGSRVFFSARTGLDDYELWSASAARGSSRLVRDIRPGAEGSRPSQLTRIGSQVALIADDGTVGEELWISDGTPGRTHLVRDIAPGAADGDLDYLTAHRGWLYLTAVDPTHGEELWRTRGTGASTRLVKDILPGPGSSDPDSLVSAGGRLVFSAADAGRGQEPWVTDGTPAGTRQVRDLYPGLASSYGYPVGVVGATVLIVAQTPGKGAEPWTWTVRASRTKASPKRHYALSQARRRQVKVLVRVTAPDVAVTGGRVVLRQGARVVGSAPVVRGRAVVRVKSRLGVGRHRLRGSYSGSVQARASVSPRFTITITRGKKTR